MITGIQHFSFTVGNLEDALHFFVDTLGFEATSIRESEGQRVEMILKMPGASVRISNVTTPGAGHIELVEYVAPTGRRIDLRTCNPGVGHIAFLVEDIEKMYRDLVAKGVEFNSPPMWSDGGALKGYGMCYFKGPDGITLELMQAPKGVRLDPATGLAID